MNKKCIIWFAMIMVAVNLAGMCLMAGCATMKDFGQWLKWWEDKPDIVLPDGEDPDEEIKDDIDLSKVITHAMSRDAILNFKVVAKVEEVWLDRFLHWRWDKDPKWKNVNGVNGNIWMFWKEGDQWHGGPCDYIRTGVMYKPRHDFKTTISPWRMPRNGEEVAIMHSTICRNNQPRVNGEERTAILKFIWPPKR